jgi:hypothetical protein
MATKRTRDTGMKRRRGMFGSDAPYATTPLSYFPTFLAVLLLCIAGVFALGGGLWMVVSGVPADDERVAWTIAGWFAIAVGALILVWAALLSWRAIVARRRAHRR